MMQKEEFLKTQMLIIKVGKTVSELNLESFLEMLEGAQVIAPAQDKALYAKAKANMDAIKELVKTLIPVKAAQENVMKVVLAKLKPMGQNAKIPRT